MEEGEGEVEEGFAVKGEEVKEGFVDVDGGDWRTLLLLHKSSKFEG